MLRAFYQRGDCMGVTLKQRSCDEVWGYRGFRALHALKTWSILQCLEETHHRNKIFTEDLPLQIFIRYRRLH